MEKRKKKNQSSLSLGHLRSLLLLLFHPSQPLQHCIASSLAPHILPMKAGTIQPRAPDSVLGPQRLHGPTLQVSTPRCIRPQLGRRHCHTGHQYRRSRGGPRGGVRALPATLLLPPSATGPEATVPWVPHLSATAMAKMGSQDGAGE